ncbi:MAG: DUF3108 domain-containing protein [Dysgonamonadaceae bacterium]|jgi:hypothetical protein|nr:DUF3108 domain-containing protein [Dysgonamonadaceae bacterium]
MKRIFSLLALFFCISSVYAEGTPFGDGEILKYNIRFKWGLVMVKAGTANYAVQGSSYENNSAYKTTLDFRSSPFFDGVFKIRDTLFSYMNTDLEPLYHIRKINEGKTRFQEEVFVIDHDVNYTKVRVRRQSAETVKFDTLLVSDNAGYDMLSIFAFARTLDYPNLEQNQTFRISSFVGTDKVNITVHFKGQAILEKSESVKYKACRLSVDIGDSAFNETKNAMEIWVSDDKNHIPLKIKAKLKIGAAEADLTSWQNLKYPFASEITIPASRLKK